jgi:hypothetical protein
MAAYRLEKDPYQPDLKIEYRAKQRIFNRGLLNGRETLKETFKVLSLQGNANQYAPEIHSFTH